MLPAVFLVLTLVTVPLFGGRLLALGELNLRHGWAIFAAIGLQLVVISMLPAQFSNIQPYAHMGTYFLAAWFVFANRRVPGVALIGLGGLMNFAAIAANGGTMPASASALATAGLIHHDPGDFANSAALGSPNLAFLGDIFATPHWLPLANVFSLGDITIALGTAVAIHRLCGSRLVPSATGEFSQLLQNRSFVRLWTGQVVANLGDFAYSIAVLVALSARGVGPGILATLLIAQVAPAALVGIFGGVAADRFSRKQLMIVSDLLRCAAVASLLLVPSPSLVHFYVVAGCLGVFGALFQPSLQASLPSLVGPRLLVAANSLVTATFHTAVMAGPLIGGLLAAHVGASPAFALNAASFAISAATIFGIKMKTGPKEKTDTPRALMEGIRYSLGSPMVRGILIVTGLTMFAASIKSPLEPLFILRVIHGHAQDLGFAEASWGLGMLLGSVAAPAAVRRWSRVKLLHAGLGAIGVCIFVASWATSLFPVLLLWMIGGSGNALATVSFSSLLQEYTPDRVRGRVVAGLDAVLNSATVLGVLAAGLIASAIGVRAAYAAAGTLMLAAVFVGHRVMSPAASIEQHEPDTDSVPVGLAASVASVAPPTSIAPPVTIAPPA